MPAGSGVRTFADRLRALLERSGRTQADLARLAEVDQSSISRYLRGECEPNLRQLRSIAHALEVSAAILVGDDSREVVAIESRNGREAARYLLFLDGELVGEWRGGSIATVLTVRHVSASDAQARQLLDGMRRKNGSRRRR